MHTVDIKVYILAHTRLCVTSRTWLNDLDARDYQLPLTDEPTTLVALAAKRCYMSFQVGLNPNVQRIREDMVAYIDNILQSGHGSVLEHATYTFAFEGVSRVFTGEMNRHRAGVAISEGSMRFIRFTDIPFWMPHSIVENEDDSDLLKEKKRRTREIFNRVFAFVEAQYTEAVQLWEMDRSSVSFAEKKQITSCLRRLIPMGVATGGVWTMNLRAIRHIIALRTSPAAEEEICYVFRKVLELVAEASPCVFGDFDERGEPKYPKV